MSNNFKAYEGMGSILARLPFSISLENLRSNRLSDEEQYLLRDSLHSSAAILIRARQYYALEEMAIEALAEGFALELVRVFVDARVEEVRPVQTMHVDGDVWELVFDPGAEIDRQRTDEKGRVWRKVEIAEHIPF